MKGWKSNHQQPQKVDDNGRVFCLRFNLFGTYHHWHWEKT